METVIALSQPIETITNGELTLKEVIELFEISEIFERYGQWVVTKYGLECLVTQYAISKERLIEQDWASHLSEKRWVRPDEFEIALKAAISFHDVAPVIMPEIPARPNEQVNSNRVVDMYTADKLKESLLSLHVAYKAIIKHVPDNLPRPELAPSTFSVKDDGILSPLYAGFAYLIDGFLATVFRSDLRDYFNYETLLNYTREQFEYWLDKIIESISS